MRNDAPTERDQMLQVSTDDPSYNSDMSTAKYCFMVLGFGYLFPCYALAQPVDYWHLLFPSFEVSFEIFWAYNIASVTTLFFIVWKGGKQWYTGRIVGGFITQVLVLLLLPLSHFILTSQTQNLVMVLGSTVLVSIATSFLDSSVFSLANLFPIEGIEYVQLGMGFSTVVSSLYRLLTKAFFSADKIFDGTLLYFCVGAVTVGFGILAYSILFKLRLTHRCITQAKQDIVRFSLIKKIWKYESMITLSYACSLVIWPGMISAMPSYNFPDLNDSGWWPLLLLALYSVCELIGRYLVRYRGNITAHNMWMFVLPRFLLIPLSVCSVQGVSGFANDYISIAITIATSLSAGYVGTMSIVVVNDCIEIEEQSATGMLSSFFLNVGLILGSTVGLILAKLLNM